MEEQCLVLSGDWVCGEGGKWDFIFEKNRMGRTVQMYEGIGVKELEGNVLREFRVYEARHRVSLSYWPPTSFKLATGIRTPPVLITNSGAFELKAACVDDEFVDDSGMGFVSQKSRGFWGERMLVMLRGKAT
ncbi:unnamed protein product [Brassica rapa]|uniref:Uncharacterized protein n=2 Tax=Brassica TaxID=3705 RepID=A0A3P6AKH0_BRACM|nr:unnamed protein product [Brassica napus]CAG7894424.1 unnamed protein product [Brassica rapa]VDC90245.1 unnamed protein product [Brassica rapa]